MREVDVSFEFFDGSMCGFPPKNNGGLIKNGACSSFYSYVSICVSYESLLFIFMFEHVVFDLQLCFARRNLIWKLCRIFDIKYDHKSEKIKYWIIQMIGTILYTKISTTKEYQFTDKFSKRKYTFRISNYCANFRKSTKRYRHQITIPTIYHVEPALFVYKPH